MSDPFQAQAEAIADAQARADATAGGQPPTGEQPPSRRRGPKKKPPAPPRQRRAGLLSHESHTQDIPLVAAELGLPVHTVRGIVQRAVQDWQAENSVRELVRRYFESRLKTSTTAE